MDGEKFKGTGFRPPTLKVAAAVEDLLRLIQDEMGTVEGKNALCRDLLATISRHARPEESNAHEG